MGFGVAVAIDARDVHGADDDSAFFGRGAGVQKLFQVVFHGPYTVDRSAEAGTMRAAKLAG